MLVFTIFNPISQGMCSSWGQNVWELLPCVMHVLRMQIKTLRIKFEFVTDTLMLELRMLKQDGQKTMR
jgi:CHAD domain-containing protein